MATSFLSLNDLSVRDSDVTILENISFRLKKNQKLVIAGETGSGKSTLLKCIAGLEQATSGVVTFDGERVEGAQERLVPGHAQIAYLSQYFELPKSLRVEQVLSYSNELSISDATDLYQICQIDHLLKRRTNQLSGGERQRIGLARALIRKPLLLLLDEPFSNLDVIHKNTLKDVIRDVGRKLRITCILVSHDPQDTLSWADEILVLQAGKIVQMGTPEIIYNQPANPYVAGLFGKFNDFESLMKCKPPSRFIRPEWMEPCSRKEGEFKGLVVETKFFGRFWENEVIVNEIILCIQTAEPLELQKLYWFRFING